MGTIDDLRRWHLALKNGSVLSREMLGIATTPYVFPNGEISERGFGFTVGSIDGRRLVFSSGDGMSHSRHGFLLDQDISVVVNVNFEIVYDDDQPSDLRNQLLGGILQTNTITVFGQEVSLTEFTSE